MKKLIYKDGNLLTDPSIAVIGHQANCQNTFGSGIAASIKEMYPSAYEADTLSAKNKANVLGNISYVGTKKDDRHVVIFNLYGQNLFGKETRKTDYEALFSALSRMKGVCDMAKGTYSALGKPMPTVGFPYKMGCDRGGGDWRIVERLIEVAFEGYEGDVAIVKYNESKNR